MPVHFNSFIEDSEEKLKEDLFANILSKYTQNADDIFVTEDKKTIHMTNYLREKNNNIVGKVIITLKVRENSIELVDTDITLINNEATLLRFENKLKQSSEANEYYEVITKDGSHFKIETVNRYVNKQENIVNTEQEVYLSAFPFQLDIYSNLDELNKSLGFEKPVEIANTGMFVSGYPSKMMSVGDILTGRFDDEPCSFIIGEIEEFKDVSVNIAGILIDFTIINIMTASGRIPVATHRGNFNLSKLEKGNILAMLADIKSDFKK